MITIINIIKTLPRFAIHNQLYRHILFNNKTTYEVSFFRQSWRNKQYAITERIKRCTTSEQITEIISANGKQLNIVHMTAILDRIEQEGMLNIQSIVDFVVQRLKLNRLELLDIENARAFCNIACYLGNLKNTELNHIFVQADYNRLLNNRKTVEITMLITGLIRLGIFKDIFGIKHQKSKKELLLQDIITAEFTRNQILSIWYAYISQISKQNHILSNYLNELLGNVYKKDVISLKTYTYSFICYLRTMHILKDCTKGPLYNIIAHQIPLTTKDHLLPYQFSLLLHSINNLKRNKMQLDEKTIQTIKFPVQFRKLLVSQFSRICLRKNVTLRNIANNFKQFHEAFGVNEAFLHLTIQKVISIIEQEIKVASKTDNYQMNYKIDLLSLCSLTWKLGENFDKIEYKESIEQAKSLYSRFVALTVSYFKLISNIGLIQKMTNKQLLMLFSGFALLKGKIKLQFDDDFVQKSIKVVVSQKRKYSVKQITLLFTYFKTIKLYNQNLCEFIHLSLSKSTQSQQFSKNIKAKSILQKKCTLGIGSKCFNCYNAAKQQGEETLK